MMLWTAILLLATLHELQPTDWPQFRGWDAAGIAQGSPPLAWSVEAGQNIAWKVPLPGRGVSGPIVIGNQVFVTSSSGPQQEQLHVFAVAQDTGAMLWQRDVWGTGRTACHPLSAMSAPTPASDGQRLLVLFASNDLICLSLTGDVQWIRCLGLEYPLAFDDRGLAASPLVIGDVGVIQISTQGTAFVMAVDLATGQTRWQHPLAPKTSWSSPIRMSWNGQQWIVVQTADEVCLLDPATGVVKWRYEVAGGLIPTAVARGTSLLLPAKGLTLLELNPDADELALKWQSNSLGPQSASPLVLDTRVFVIRPPNMLTCGDLQTGEVLWKTRIKGEQFWATPAIADRHMYIASADGYLQVVDLDQDGKSLGIGALDEEILGSPAIAGNAIFVRGVGHLWKIAESPAEDSRR